MYFYRRFLYQGGSHYFFFEVRSLRTASVCRGWGGGRRIGWLPS
jgi:hypothetical protein